MTDTLDDFVEDLQKRIYEETREAYGDAAFERWLNPVYQGTLDDPDGYARITGSCGDTMEIYLKFENGKIKEAAYRTDGCGSSSVCGSYAAEMAHDKTPDEVLDVTGEAIIEKLGGLPEEERHCAFLAAEALQEALHQFMLKKI